MPPPQARKLQESYAKALKLERRRPVRGMPFSNWPLPRLAGFRPMSWKTNRLVQKLPALFRQLRARGQGRTDWVTARHLEFWADTLDARATLPQLVRRLDPGDWQAMTGGLSSPRTNKSSAPAGMGSSRR